MLRSLTYLNCVTIVVNCYLIGCALTRSESMSATQHQTQVIGEADYKGKHYPVLYKGRFEFEGRMKERTKLAFQDLSKEFWVDFSALDNFEKFPQPVDASDYQPDVQPGRMPSVDQEKPAEETPSYCAHCGQRID